MRAFVLAGTHSGCGKTTLTLGLLAALRKKDLVVQPFKVGPDFIDSGLHRLVTGRVSRNLDLWMCGETYVRSCFRQHSFDADVAMVEGVMGLYDGNPSTATLARTLGLPVVLVVDAYGMAESAGPLVKGFLDYWEPSGDDGPLLKGVIFNRVASPRHFERLAKSVKEVRVLGYLPRDLRFEIPHRHLGLVIAEEQPVSMESLEGLAATVLEHVDVECLLDISRVPVLPSPDQGPPSGAGMLRGTRPVRVAVAFDKAFCFYYQDNLDLLESQGVEIVRFSPLADAALPENIDALYLGGGYPELHAARLASNLSMRASIREWALLGGGPVYGECGGFMYLCRTLHDFDGSAFDMAGVFPYETEMIKGRAHLGYRQVSLVTDCMLGRANHTARGHEFHYSRIREPKKDGVDLAYRVSSPSGEDLGLEGYRLGNVLGSYTHVHFGSNPAIAEEFTAFARDRRFS